ncbi:hypothetical protein FCV25MIE_14468 [Fagus crenata]
MAVIFFFLEDGETKEIQNLKQSPSATWWPCPIPVEADRIHRLRSEACPEAEVIDEVEKALEKVCPGVLTGSDVKQTNVERGSQIGAAEAPDPVIRAVEQVYELVQKATIQCMPPQPSPRPPSKLLLVHCFWFWHLVGTTCCC